MKKLPEGFGCNGKLSVCVMLPGTEKRVVGTYSSENEGAFALSFYGKDGVLEYLVSDGKTDADFMEAWVYHEIETVSQSEQRRRKKRKNR